MSDLVLQSGDSIPSSVATSWLQANAHWNDKLFPAFEITAGPQVNSILAASHNSRTLLISNQSKVTVLRDDHTSPVLTNVYIVNCSETTVYIASPVKNVTIVGCLDTEVVIMAATGSITCSHSDKVLIRAVASNLRLENTMDCSIFAYTMRAIILTGDSRGVTLAPFNVIWSRHELVLNSRTSLHPDSSHATLWSQPICSTLTESPYVLLPPNKFRLSCFPEFDAAAQPELAVCLPQIYSDAFKEKLKGLSELKLELLQIGDEANLNKVNAVLSGHFREWLTTNNKTRTMIDIMKQHNQ